jgi:ankyrin repeat protein
MTNKYIKKIGKEGQTKKQSPFNKIEKEKKPELASFEKKEFFKAIRKNDLEKVKKLVENGMDIEVKDSRGNTALQVALKAFNTEYGKVGVDVIRFLYEKGAKDIDGEGIEIHYDQRGNSIMDIQPVWHLLNEHDFNKLTTAIFFNDKNTLSQLLEKGADIEACDDDGNTVLMYAILHSELESAKFLIEKGANINASNIMNIPSSPLTLACEFDSDIIDSLIEKNVKVRLKHLDLEDISPRMISKIKVYIQKLKSHFLQEIQKGNLEEVEKLLGNDGIDLVTKYSDIDFKTALILAVEKGHTDIVKLFIDEGADLNSTDNEGKTALDYAKKNNYTEIIELLNAASAKK